jgi:hypothetical protein
MASLASAIANGLHRASSAALGAAASVAKSGTARFVQAPLLHDKGTEIDSLKGYLKELITRKHFSLDGSPSDQLTKEKATLSQFRDKTLSFLAKSKELFLIDLSTPKYAQHAQPFNDLIAALEQEIQNPQASGELSQNTLDAANAALIKLDFLKAERAGYLSKSRLLANNPLLCDFLKHLCALEMALQYYKSDKASSLPLSASMDTLLKSKADVFRQLSPQDELTLTRFKLLFEAYCHLPTSLKEDLQFRGNHHELVAVTQQVKTIVENHISSSQGYGTMVGKALFKLVKDSAKDLLKESLPSSVGAAIENAPPPSAPHHSPFQKLHDAMGFFLQAGQKYELAAKKTIVLSLIDECDQLYPEFKQRFFDTIASTYPGDDPMPDDWVVEHLLDTPEVAFKAAITAAATEHEYAPTAPQNTQAILTFLNTQKQLQPPTILADTHPIMACVEAALEYINGHSTISEGVLSILGSAFSSLLEGDLLKSWIATQPPENQEAINASIQQAREALAIAKTSKDYKKVFEEFKTLWKEKIHPFYSAKEANALNKAFHDLSHELIISKPKEDVEFDWSKESAEAREKKLEKQFEELSDNLRDQLTYEFIYKKVLGSKSDDLLYNIKDLQKIQGKDRDKMKNIFLSELKKGINNSDASFLWKAIAHLLILFKIYTVIGRHANNIISRFYKDLTSHLEKIDKKDLVTRTSNCFSKYSSLLEAWAKSPNGGDKTPVIDDLMKTPKYLSYGSEAYSQSELYNAVSNQFVDNYFDFYKDDKEQEDSFSASLDKKLHDIKNFSFKSYFSHSYNPITTFLNYLFIGAKATLMWLPALMIIKIVSLPIRLAETLTNKIMKMTLKKVLEKNKTIESIIESARDGVYENNPYVHAITSFLADQLETLSQELDDLDTENAKPLVSEKTRGMIKKAAEGLIEVLNKDKFTTQDFLKNYLDQKGSWAVSTAQNKLEQIVLPYVIESIIDITAMASEKFINKGALQQPLSLLLDKINELVTQKPEELSEEQAKAELLKYKAAEDKLKKYTNKLINQIAKKAIDDAFDSQGQNQFALIRNAKEWIEHHTPIFLQLWRDHLINPLENGDDIDIQHLHVLHEKTITFLTELENKWDVLKHDSSHTGKEMAKLLSTVMNPLQHLLRGENNENGFLAFYKNSKLIDQTHQDLPHLLHCKQAYEFLDEKFPHLQEELSSDLDTTIFANSLYIKTTLSKLRSGELEFLRSPSIYEPLMALVKTSKMEERETEEALIKENLLPTLKFLESLPQQSLDDLSAKKQANLNKHPNFFDFFKQNNDDPFIQMYNTLLNKIRALPSEKTKNMLLPILKEIYQAKNVNDASLAINRFKAALDKALLTERGALEARIKAIKKIDTEFHEVIAHVCETLEEDLETYLGSNAELSGRILEAYEELQEASLNLPPIKAPDPNAKSGLIGMAKESGVDVAKAASYKLAYHLSRPKIDGLFDLLRNGSFSQFFANHVLFMPFVKK